MVYRMPDCCGCGVYKAFVNLSGFASLLFFGLVVILMFSRIQHDLVLFVLSVLYCVETLLFFKYYIDIVCLFRMKFRWHANRVWVPLADLCVVTIAAAIAFNLLELDAEGSVIEQLFSTSDQQLFSVVSVAVGLLLKLISALMLTVLHVRTIKLQPKMDSFVNMETFPYNATAPAYYEDEPL